MLLAEDEAVLTPLTWQTMYPYPARKDGARDRRVERVEGELNAFRRIAPEVEGLHPLGATTPQECTDITAHVGESLRFDTIYHVPSYLDWLERRGHAGAFRFHKRFLQHLQAQVGGPRRWVLKCPDHVFTLDAIFETYPDARIVFMHRDPMSVLPSVAKLTEALRAPFTRRCDKRGIGAEITERWYDGTEKIIDAARSLPSSRVLNLRFQELVADPLATTERLYQHFDLPFDGAVRGRFQTFLDNRPKGGYEHSRYDPAEFGLEAGPIREKFASYGQALAEFGTQAAA
jgi:hypothetical protein